MVALASGEDYLFSNALEQVFEGSSINIPCSLITECFFFGTKF